MHLLKPRKLLQYKQRLKISQIFAQNASQSYSACSNPRPNCASSFPVTRAVELLPYPLHHCQHDVLLDIRISVSPPLVQLFPSSNQSIALLRRFSFAVLTQFFKSVIGFSVLEFSLPCRSSCSKAYVSSKQRDLAR